MIRRLHAAALLLGLLPMSAAERPALVVVVSIDQCSSDLVQRWMKGLPGGLGQLTREGTWFTQAYHDHGWTETGPGHSVLLSGRFPARTGIPENTWLDPRTFAAVYCVGDPATRLLAQPEARGSSPLHFRGTALGDWLQAQVPGSRVFTVSGKDRAAVLMGGRRPSGAFWFTPQARFDSSTAYAQALPAWLQAYNQSLARRLAHENWTWTPLPDTPGQARQGGTYATFRGPVSLGLPRLVKGVGMPLDGEFDKRFRASPFLDEVILEAAEALMDGEGLGKGPGTDLLAVGLSATDAIGHAYGNGGEEMRDQVLRLDRRLGRFLDRLRARVPRSWVVLTADHGCADFPERLTEQGYTARRLDVSEWKRDVAAAMETQKSGAGKLFRTLAGQQFTLDPQVAASLGLSRAASLDLLTRVLKARSEVEAVFTSEMLEGPQEARKDPGLLSLQGRLALSHVPGRSGDLQVVLKPLILLSDGGSLADHGSPWDYDRRVPLVFHGPWQPEQREEPVSLVDLAPTLARELQVKPTETLDGKALELKRRGRQRP